MKVRYFIAIVFTIIGLHVVNGQENNDIFTIYLVRHAEKELTSKNPPLTKCGEQRAVSLSNFFEKVNLNAVYSTDYTRTKSTAKPTAKEKNKELKLYNPRELNDFAKLLIERKEDALVVGHSNTTGILAGLLIDKKIEAFDESIYNRIYQVVIHKETGRLHILHSAFVCNTRD